MSRPAKKNVLFICDNNTARSYTAETLFRNNIEYSQKYFAKSVGLYEKSMKILTEKLLLCADIIFVFEGEHIREIKKRFPVYKSDKLINLDIPDLFGYMDSELLYLIREKTRSHLQ